MFAIPTVAELCEISEAHGLDRLGVCSADVFIETRVALRDRKEAGLAADMQFTYRNPDRSTDVSRSLPGARSIVVGALSYRRSAPPSPQQSTGNGRIGEYVWEPFYERLRDGLRAVALRLETDGWQTRILVDDNALVDRAAAHRAGIGWFGKNSNLLVPEKGSRFVLGSVVTDAPLAVQSDVVEDACGSCRRCIDSCPTGAIIDDGVIDARRCLAWLVQSAGTFPHEFRVALDDRIYGCDDCQATCPPNLLHDRHDSPKRTTGETHVEVAELLTLDDDQLVERFGVWYIPHREVRYVRRNALIVLANTADPTHPDTRELVTRYVNSSDEIERSHAVWAAHQLGFDDLVAGVTDDPNQLVQAELAILTSR